MGACTPGTPGLGGRAAAPVGCCPKATQLASSPAMRNLQLDEDVMDFLSCYSAASGIVFRTIARDHES
jgi:N-acetyl-gamma-glutamylphosphate reductase